MVDLDKIAREAAEEILDEDHFAARERIIRRALARAAREARIAGWEDGVREFAVWRDGRQHVGCMGKPLKGVLANGPSDASPESKRAFATLRARMEVKP